MLDITADELILRIDSDIAIQYALHTTSLETQPFSRRNLFYFIVRLEAYENETGINLIEECFKNITSEFARDMGLDQPGNSGHIKNPNLFFQQHVLSNALQVKVRILLFNIWQPMTSGCHSYSSIWR